MREEAYCSTESAERYSSYTCTNPVFHTASAPIGLLAGFRGSGQFPPWVLGAMSDFFLVIFVSLAYPCVNCENSPK